jgi:dihydroxy-acid dehydratase
MALSDDINKFSKRLTQDPAQPGSQAMLYATGLSEEDLNKAQVGIVSTGWEGNPCNMHLNVLSGEIKSHVVNSGLVGFIFHTIGVSDGISMGTSGMRYSLPSRDIIADSIETVVSAQWYDALVATVGCDKNMPGALMAIGRLNRPSIIVYGGTISAGTYKGKKLDIVSAFEALGAHAAGKIDEQEYKSIVRNACPGAGACGGMYTANTMSSAIEAMGMSLPYNACIPANHPDKAKEASFVSAAIRNCLKLDLKPRDIVTRKSLENALSLIMALGGSTNAVLHMLAIAKAFEIPLELQDIQRISDNTPFLANMKPSGRYVMEDLHEIGGIPAVMKLLLEHGFIDGSAMTVTGKTIAENLEHLPGLQENQDIISDPSTPLKPSGHLQILFGNLAEEGSVAKITGKEGEYFEGSARVFDSEQAANEAIQARNIKAGEVIVIRYCGPKGGPGMPEMLKPTSLMMGTGMGKQVALITDGRFSGGTHGFVVGHISPEAYTGGMIALIEDGDSITIDSRNKKIQLNVQNSILEARKRIWTPPIDQINSGILKKYRKSVSSASKGCITDE